MARTNTARTNMARTNTAGMKRSAGGSPVRVFDAPVRIPSRRAATLAVTLATWALLIVTVPLYFVFLLNNLPDVFAIVANMRAPIGGRDVPTENPDAPIGGRDVPTEDSDAPLGGD